MTSEEKGDFRKKYQYFLVDKQNKTFICTLIVDSFGISPPWMAIPMALSLTFVPRDLKLWKAFIMSELCWSLVHFLKIHFLSFLLKLALLWKYYGHEQWGNLTLWQQIITIELAWTCNMSHVRTSCVSCHDVRKMASTLYIRTHILHVFYHF